MLTMLFALSAQSFSATVGFEPFFAEFRKAVARNDAVAVAALTQTPFLFDNQPRDRAGLQKIYPRLFDSHVRTCFAKAKAVVEQDAWMVACGRYLFNFRQVNGQYRLSEFAADPEVAP
jgi:hypothetical protein